VPPRLDETNAPPPMRWQDDAWSVSASVRLAHRDLHELSRGEAGRDVERVRDGDHLGFTLRVRAARPATVSPACPRASRRRVSRMPARSAGVGVRKLRAVIRNVSAKSRNADRLVWAPTC